MSLSSLASSPTPVQALCPGPDPAADWLDGSWDTPDAAAQAHTSWCPCHGDRRPAARQDRITLVTVAADMTGMPAWECDGCQAIRSGFEPPSRLCDHCQAKALPEQPDLPGLSSPEPS